MSKNPMDRAAFAYQQAAKTLKANEEILLKPKMGSPEQQQAAAAEAQAQVQQSRTRMNEVFESIINETMTNPDGTPMMYQQRMKSGSYVEKPMTLDKYVKVLMRNKGLDPENSYAIIMDCLKLTKSSFQAALNSKLHYFKSRSALEDKGWQKVRKDRSVKKFKDYFDPKSDKFVPSGQTDDIIEAFENRHYGDLSKRQAKADEWNKMSAQLDKITGNQKPHGTVGVDPRSPKERGKKGPDGKVTKGKDSGFKVKPALDAWYATRKYFSDFMIQHPEKARELGLMKFLKPGGDYYLSKAMIKPGEDNLATDIDATRHLLGKGKSIQPQKPNKIENDDIDNQGYADDSGQDDDDDVEAALRTRTVVAELADTMYDPSKDEALYKVAMLLSSLRFPTEMADDNNIDTMISWFDENRKLFASESNPEAKFRQAVRTVLTDCVEAFAGEKSLNEARTSIRSAGFVLVSKLVARS